MKETNTYQIEFNTAAELVGIVQGHKRKNTKPKKIKTIKTGKKHEIEELRVEFEPQQDATTKFDNNFKMTPQKVNRVQLLTPPPPTLSLSPELTYDETVVSDADLKPGAVVLIFLCDRCNLILTTRSEFDKHYVKEHNSQPQYCCFVCSKQIAKFTAFRTHCRRHAYPAKGDAEPQKCDKCTEQFATKSMLRLHQKQIHLVRVETAPKQGGGSCPDCGKVLLTSGGLYTHRKTHENPKFACDICDKKFIQKINLIHHHKKHSGLRPFICTFADCDKRFMEKSHLQRHLNHHSTQRPFVCTECRKAYKTERCLKVHGLVHSTQRPFVCPECQKGFLSRSKLKQHSNIHSGNRPYKCKYCPRDFTNFPNWLKHTRRKHKIDHKTGEKLTVVPTYKKKVTPPKPAIKVEVPPPPTTLVAETPSVSCFKVERLSESEPEVAAAAPPLMAAKYESDFIDQASAGGFNDFPEDDIEFVLRNDPEYLDLLRSRVDLDNDGDRDDDDDDDSSRDGGAGATEHQKITASASTISSSGSNVLDSDILNNFTMSNSLYPVPLYNMPQPFQFINPNSIHLLNGSQFLNSQ